MKMLAHEKYILKKPNKKKLKEFKPFLAKIKNI